LALFDQVTLHIADRCDRSTEPDRAQLHEVGEDPAEAHRSGWFGVGQPGLMVGR
jgi:hypothetical protein